MNIESFIAEIQQAKPDVTFNAPFWDEFTGVVGGWSAESECGRYEAIASEERPGVWVFGIVTDFDLENATGKRIIL